MAINLGEKYSPKVVERFALTSKTDKHAGHDYDFTGVKTIKIYSIDTVPTTDYTRSGISRFGELTELGDTVQEMTLTQDKAFTFSIDAGNASEQFNIKHANASLKRELDEVVTPEIDMYRLNKWATAEGIQTVADGALTKSNIAERVTAGIAALDNAEAPEDGRTIYIDPAKYALLRLSPEFLAADALAAKSVGKGYMGEFGGCAVVKVPAGRMPADVNFMIVHKEAAIAPEKLASAKIHKDPPGIDGNLLEGRHYYDAFVIGARAGGVYVDVAVATCAAPTMSGTTLASSGNTIAWTSDGSDPRYSNTATIGTSVAGVASGSKIKAYAYKAGGFASPVAEFTIA